MVKRYRRTGKRGPAPLYPWEKWFKRKKPFTLRRGRDFTCQPHSMAAQLRNHAYHAGKSIRVNINENVLTVQVGAYDK